MRVFVVSTVILLSFVLALLLSVALNFQNPYLEVCAIINENYFSKDSEFNNFIKECQRRASKVKWHHSREQIVGDLKYFLPSLRVSHLSIYEPPETKRYWTGEAKHTGAFARFTDGHLMINKVIFESPAQKAGLQVGDEILKINHELPGEFEVQSVEGEFEILRESKVLVFNVSLESIQIDQQPKLVRLSSKVGLLEVSSFRKIYFHVDKMRELQKDLKSFSSVILDLRQNIGGNIVAGRRLLDLFYCHSTFAGEMRRRDEEIKDPLTMPDEIDELMQIDFLMKNRGAVFKTTENPECFKGSIVVLVDSASASTTEYVAKVFQATKRATIMGNLSAGRALLGLWFPLPRLGKDYAISVPILEIQVKGIIEGLGVRPDKVLAYDYELEKQAKDSWLEKALYHIETTKQFTPPD